MWVCALCVLWVFAVRQSGFCCLLSPVSSLWWPSPNSSVRCCCTSRPSPRPKTSQKERCSPSTRISPSCKEPYGPAHCCLLSFHRLLYQCLHSDCISDFRQNFRISSVFSPTSYSSVFLHTEASQLLLWLGLRLSELLK